MIHIVGNAKQAIKARTILPKVVADELIRTSEELDRAYGAERNCLEVGGYSVIIDDMDDLPMLSSIVDYNSHLAEDAKKVGDYIVAVYVFNNDYSVALFAPTAIAPDSILNDLIEEE